jgi:hypothetical protein
MNRGALVTTFSLAEVRAMCTLLEATIEKRQAELSREEAELHAAGIHGGELEVLESVGGKFVRLRNKGTGSAGKR